MTELRVQVPYQPNPKQQEFHGLTAKYRGFCGGWGNGKTSAGCAEFFISLMEYPGTNSIVARKTRPELRATTWAMLLDGDVQPTGWRGIPKEVIKTYNKSDLFIELRNGSRIHGVSLDDPKKLENYNLGLYMVDQADEVEEEFFLKLQGRLRQINAPREGLWLWNPGGHNWLWERFINEHRRERWKELFKAIEATPFDNPNLPADYMEQFDSLPTHWYQRYVLGSHDVFVGQIFVDYNEEVHVIRPFHIPSEWERWMCVDPGIGHEGAVNWMARDFENNVYLYREKVEAGQPVSWWAEQIQTLEEGYDWGGPEEEITVRLIGPESQQRAQTDGKSVRDLYEEEGFEFELADKEPISRINRITQRLRPTPGHEHPMGEDPIPCYTPDGTPTGELGSPRLYFFNTCEYTLRWLPQYRWRPTRPNYTEEQPPEKPRKKNDHTVDNVGHILLAIGDSEPDVPDFGRERRTREQREMDEHFDEALAEASEMSEYHAWHPGKSLSTVG